MKKFLISRLPVYPRFMAFAQAKALWPLNPDLWPVPGPLSPSLPQVAGWARARPFRRLRRHCSQSQAAGDIRTTMIIGLASSGTGDYAPGRVRHQAGRMLEHLIKTALSRPVLLVIRFLLDHDVLMPTHTPSRYRISW